MPGSILPTPDFKLSDKSKERLRKVDEVRPYLHRAALFGLPAMGAANYLTSATNPRKALIVGATGLGAAGLGLLDRKIESLAEEHEELRPTLKHYSKGVTPSAPAPTVKAASAFTRVRRNREELAEAFPMTAAARSDLQKEGVALVDPRAVAKQGLSALRFMQGVKPTAIGAGLGAAYGGLTAEKGHGVRGALTGAAVGGALGAGTTGLARKFGRPIESGLVAAKGRGLRPDMVSPETWQSNFRQGFMQEYRPPAPPAGTPAPAVVPPPRAIETTMEKLNGMDTTTDAHRAIGGRPPYALLTLSAETSNDAVINQMLRGLFANTDAMRKATEEQVLAAFPLSQPYSYGRHRAIGRTAEDIKAEIALAYTPTKR